MIAENEAHAQGCGQVLRLDSATRRRVEESGTMNFLVVTADGELVTPPSNGQILAGITRDSLLTIAAAHGLRARWSVHSGSQSCAPASNRE